MLQYVKSVAWAIYAHKYSIEISKLLSSRRRSFLPSLFVTLPQHTKRWSPVREIRLRKSGQSEACRPSPNRTNFSFSFLLPPGLRRGSRFCRHKTFSFCVMWLQEICRDLWQQHAGRQRSARMIAQSDLKSRAGEDWEAKVLPRCFINNFLHYYGVMFVIFSCSYFVASSKQFIMLNNNLMALDAHWVCPLRANPAWSELTPSGRLV